MDVMIIIVKRRVYFMAVSACTMWWHRRRCTRVQSDWVRTSLDGLEASRKQRE